MKNSKSAFLDAKYAKKFYASGHRMAKKLKKLASRLRRREVKNLE